MIPKKLHIVWIGEESHKPVHHIQSWIDRHPGWNVTIWGNEQLAGHRWRLSRQMAQLGAIDLRAVVEAMRMQILFEQGGFAVDADTFCIAAIPDAMRQAGAVGCWADETFQPGILSSGFIGMAAGHAAAAAWLDALAGDDELAAKPFEHAAGCQRYTQIWRARYFEDLVVYPSRTLLSAQRAAAGRGAGPGVIALHERASTRGIVASLHRHRLPHTQPPPGMRTARQDGAMGAAPLFTIGIVTYNRADLLANAIDSALRQSDPDFELLVVDDGSTDETPQLLAGVRDARLRSVRQANGGEAAARNCALREARGRFVVWLDSDDELLPDTIAAYRAVVEREPQVDVIYGNLLRVDGQGRPDGGFRYVPGGQVGFPTLFYHNQLPNPGTAVRRERALEVGGYDVKLPTSPDYDLWTRLACAGARFEHCGGVVCRYRWHGANLSANEQKIRDADGRIAAKLAAAAPWQILFPGLEWRAQPSQARLRAAIEIARVLLERGHPGPASQILRQAADPAPAGLLRDAA